MTKSTGFAIPTIYGFLYDGIRDYLADKGVVDPAQGYVGATVEHQKYLTAFSGINTNYRDLLGTRLKTIGADSVEPINQFLQTEGFNIQLQPFSDAEDVGGAGVLHVGVEWLFKGSKTSIYTLDDAGSYQSYPGVEIKGGVRFFTAPSHPNPIVQVGTKTDDMVYMTIASQPLEGIDLYLRLAELQATKRIDQGAYFDGVRFPMIDLDVQPDITSLKGLMLPRPQGRPYEVMQAVSQVMFKMNEKGAQTDAAAAGSVGITSGPMAMMLNKPFWLWKTAGELQAPVLTAYLDIDSWSDPGDFDINNG